MRQKTSIKGLAEPPTPPIGQLFVIFSSFKVAIFGVILPFYKEIFLRIESGCVFGFWVGERSCR